MIAAVRAMSVHCSDCGRLRHRLGWRCTTLQSVRAPTQRAAVRVRAGAETSCRWRRSGARYEHVGPDRHNGVRRGQLAAMAHPVEVAPDRSRRGRHCLRPASRRIDPILFAPTHTGDAPLGFPGRASKSMRRSSTMVNGCVSSNHAGSWEVWRAHRDGSALERLVAATRPHRRCIPPRTTWPAGLCLETTLPMNRKTQNPYSSSCSKADDPTESALD